MDKYLNSRMQKVKWTVAAVSLFALFYQLSPFIGIGDKFIMAMFLLSPFLLVTMVWVILRFGKAPDTSFEDRFYEDYDPYEKDSA